jgi:hypothetical protein
VVEAGLEHTICLTTKCKAIQGQKYLGSRTFCLVLPPRSPTKIRVFAFRDSRGPSHYFLDLRADQPWPARTHSTTCPSLSPLRQPGFIARSKRQNWAPCPVAHTGRRNPFLSLFLLYLSISSDSRMLCETFPLSHLPLQGWKTLRFSDSQGRGDRRNVTGEGISVPS